MADKNKMEVNIVPQVDKQALKKAGKELEQFAYTLEEATWTNSKTGKSGKMPVVKSDRFTGLLNARGNGYVLPGEGLTARDLINMYNNNLNYFPQKINNRNYSKNKNQPKKINIKNIKDNTIKSLNDVEYFLNNFSNTLKYIKLINLLK